MREKTAPATIAGPQLREGRCVNSELKKEIFMTLEDTF